MIPAPICVTVIASDLLELLEAGDRRLSASEFIGAVRAKVCAAAGGRPGAKVNLYLSVTPDLNSAIPE